MVSKKKTPVVKALPAKKASKKKATTKKPTKAKKATAKKKAQAKKKTTPRKKNPGGRPPKQIDYKMLNNLCQIQCTGEEIAHMLEIDYDTLNRKLKLETGKCFTEYYDEKRAGGKCSLRRRQFLAAQDGNTTMLIWLGKQYLGQSDKLESKNENTEIVLRFEDE